MSKKHYEYCCYPQTGCGCNYNNIWPLIILILIVLKFSNKKDHDCDDEGFFGGLIDNGILFIITLFLLVYCGCGKY
ncbi:hypothetical protein SAMN05443428_11047 [Caloramator quimbayensis]|uniref:Uncharacterized protein n=1 Tax=Caloramator quimbayensis TaxID=1147123 RepID=A0A1T4XLA9_9CLOT|nr:hypothetical protein [Caloramator quimbayensis]SKA90173.1 hypothetical protein SAMN05443428_11047 [Caloramator quimbayensis]